MSISVVPAAAAAARAKQIGHKTKQPVKKPEDEQVTHTDENAEGNKAELHTAKSHDQADTPPGPGGEAFQAALVEAAALQGADAGAESVEGPEAYEADDGDNGNTPLLIGGAVLIGGGIIAIAAGGGDDDDDGDNGGTPANAAPTFSAATQAVTTAEDSDLVITAAATDANNDALTYTNTNPTKGTVTRGTDGKYTYSPNDDFNGTDSFTVTASDGKGGTATQTINITITPVNDDPTAPATNAATTDQGVPVTISIGASDVDGDTLTYTASGVDGGAVTFVDGKATYTPTATFSGTDSFTVTIDDGKGGKITQAVTVTVVADGPETVSIDVGSNTEAVAFDAASDDFLYTDDSTKLTNVVIDNLDQGDRVQVSAASSDYNFTSVGDDIQISFNNTNAGVLNTIVLTGLAANGGFVFDEATAEAAAGFDFFNALTLPGGNGSADGVAALDGNLDDDDDANILTQATTSAAGDDIAFTESALIANNISVTDFTAGDTILVSGAPTSSYSFGTAGANGEDIQIVFNNGGVVSQIVLIGANADGATITNEAQAEAAVGSDFFQPAPIVTPGTNQAIDNGSNLATLDASGNGINFTDNALVSTNVVITGFTADDLITVTGRNATDYNFTTDDNQDLRISYTTDDASASNSIVLDNVLVDPGFIANYDQAVEAVGFNFMNFA